jgi:hypothetical protein
MGILRRLFGGGSADVTRSAGGLASADRRLDRLRRHLPRADRERIEWARELVGPGDTVWQIGAGARWFAVASAIRAGARGTVLAVAGTPAEAVQIRSDAHRLGAFDARLDVDWAPFGERGAQAAPLDELLGRHPRPTVLRIDLPPLLAKVLAGGERLLGQARPVLLLEVEARPDEEVWDRLRRAGYELFDAERNPSDRIRLDALARHTLAIPKT